MTTQDWLEAFLRAGAADVLSAATIHIYPFEPGLQNLGQKRGSKGTEVAERRSQNGGVWFSWEKVRYNNSIICYTPFQKRNSCELMLFRGKRFWSPGSTARTSAARASTLSTSAATRPANHKEGGGSCLNQSKTNQTHFWKTCIDYNKTCFCNLYCSEPCFVFTDPPRI